MPTRTRSGPCVLATRLAAGAVVPAFAVGLAVVSVRVVVTRDTV